MLMKEIERFFRPEFINRLDDIIVFRPLTKADLVQIVEYEVNKVFKRLKEQQMSWTWTIRAKDFLIEKGYNPDFGARPLRRAIGSTSRTRSARCSSPASRLDLPGLRVGVVDVPGHERFVRNMLAGASGLDVALLVVAADDGVMPQTLEHLAILELLDLRAGVIALTKTDLFEPGAEWVDLVEQDVRQRAAGTFLEQAPIVRVSAQAGTGLEELKGAIAAACEAAAQRDEAGAFRLAVDRVFVREGSGTVVTGTVWSGSAAVGDELEQQPAQRRVRVRGLHSHGAPVERVGPGERAAALLSGAHHTEIRRGDELTSPGLLRPSQTLLVRLGALPDSPIPIRHRMRVRLHLGTREVMARVRLLDGGVGEGNTPRAGSTDRSEQRLVAREGSVAQVAQLICAEPVVALGGQPVVVRAESPAVTIGGGRVLLPRRVTLPRQRAETLTHLSAMESPELDTRILSAAWLWGIGGARVEELARDVGAAPAEVDTAASRLLADGRLVACGASHLHTERAAELDALVARTLGALHDEAPLADSIAAARVAQRLDDLASAAVEGALARLAADGRARLAGGMAALAGRGPKLSDRQRAASERLGQVFEEAGFAPPASAELESLLKLSAAELRTLLELHAARGGLVHLGGGLYLHAEHEAELRARVQQRVAAGPMPVSDLRDLLGTSRKYAVPICEYLDRIGLTRRVGDARVAGPKAGAGALSGGA
jgi:selenocysteine-specific elongation factor